MKIIMKKILAAVSLAAAITACQKTEIVVSEPDGLMRFSMSLGTDTKVTADSFEPGDCVGVFVVEYENDVPAPLQISGNWVNNMSVEYDGDVWTPSKGIYWPDSVVDVYGYYPYMKMTSVDQQLFTVSLDQNTPGDDNALGGYEQSDLLWAKSEGVSKDQETVELNYKHILSKLVVNLKKGPDFEGEFPEDAVLYIHNTVPAATVEFATGVAVKDMYASAKTIKAKQIDADTFEAIIIPQRLETRRPLVEYIAGDVSFLLEDVFYFRNGKLHTLELTINESPEQIEIEIGGNISEWN